VGFTSGNFGPGDITYRLIKVGVVVVVVVVVREEQKEADIPSPPRD